MISLLLALTLAAAAPQGSPSTFALVISNNKSLTAGRSSLQYADDDGAKYYEVFAALSRPERVTLLTEMDKDTAALFPELTRVVRAPTAANVASAAGALSEAVAHEKAAGHPTELYFVFAGHGDVENGQGFLELNDKPLSASDLEAFIRQVGADRSHVILDSCNSFFVISPRKPGGRRFATPSDVTESLSRRMPNVGVLLSTSAEAEVFEWSELQSGIFSHAVRSGLLGAADANQDGKVSYQELAAFVSVTSEEVPNPLFRPKIFARGPGGDALAAVATLPAGGGSELRVDDPEAMRLTLRDGNGLRWIDAHKEAGAVLRLLMPERLRKNLEVERWGPQASGGDQVVARYQRSENAADGPLSLAMLQPGRSSERAGRGGQDSLRLLYARPFGPQALAAYLEEEKRRPEQVFGLSRDDQERMHLLLGSLASNEEDQLRVQAAGSFIGAGAFGAAGALMLASPRTNYYGILWAALGVGSAVNGLVQSLRTSDGKEALQDFERRLRMPGLDPATLVAQTESRLREIAEDRRSARRTQAFAGGVLLTTGLGVIAFSELNRGGRLYSNDQETVYVVMAALGAGQLAAGLFLQSPEERIADLWEKDPGLKQLPHLSVGATPHGGMLSLSGSF